MSLVNKLREGCVQLPKMWSGDCGVFATVDEVKTDELMREAANRIEMLTYALERIRDCNFVTTLPDRMDAVRVIAREALQ